MLELLRVRAFAIIDELEAHFAPGFNVLTGETGAGKSILVDALHLVLGGRAQADAVRTGADEAEVQALFRPRDPAATDARLSGLGLPAAGSELVVRRTVQREGRSRAWVNGALATAAQLEELEKADAQAGEDEALAQERRVLAAAEKLRAGAEEAEALLRSGDEAAVVAASRACKRLDELAGIDPSLAPVAAAVRGAAAELDEAGRTLARYAGRAGGDPQRLEAIDERLELLRRLSRKHGGSLAAALQRRETMKTELESLEHHDEALAAAEARVRELAGQALRLGRALSEKRRAGAAGFSRAVAGELSALGMARTEISVRFGPVGEGGIPAEGEVLGPYGLESAELLLSPNPGEELRPLARIASGGELSRVLLAVKRVLADADDVDTYLFDEVDAGIGGATADAVGRALAAVARGRQVICITHLPQIAVFAERHQVAEKEVRRGRTHSRVAPVEGEARVQELARLLSGQATQVALQHARELLEKARTRRAAPARKAGRGVDSATA